MKRRKNLIYISSFLKIVADIFLSKKAKSEMKRQKDMEDLKQYIVQTREENVKLSEGKKIHPFLLPSEKFSSISYKLNQTNEEFPTETHDYRCPYFPTTPHVHQLDSSYDNLLRSQNISSEFWQYFSKPETISHSKSFKFDQNFSLFNLNFEIILNPPVRTSPSINQLYEEFLEYIKCPAIEFEKELIYFNEKLSERFGNQFHSLWTEKYKPDSLTLMLGHGPQLKWLGTFLKTWQNLYSTEARNTVIISGPKGIGKTAAVYAAAQDTGFRILEINPSSKRTGKDIMDLFKEASQSHQLEKWAFADNSNSNSLLFDNNSDSVILFEEIDVLFDEDAGFFKALKDLRKISKRPIIMTCNGSTILFFGAFLTFSPFS